ncbi:MAG: CaiB/BaiF CoA transferase family protein [Candidatus Bathyarchaeia archaeon]
MKALEGIRVLDLTHAMAGPICTMFLGGMGAEVIKIEPPWGEMIRMFPPLVKGVSPYYVFINRNKKGVTLNLKHARGLEIFKEMVKKADVVVENFSPGTMDDLGLGWETLRGLNPGVIFASISGFGQTGPWSDRRSFDPIAQAASGYMWLMKGNVDPEGPPHQAPEAIADTIPGFSALIGILAALIHRNKTGRGQRIDVAQMDAMIAVSPSFAFWTVAGTTFRRAVSSYGVRVSGCHRAKDGYVMFSLPPGRITDWFRELVGMEELNREAVAAWVAERTGEEVVELLAGAGVPVSPVHDLDDVLANEQARAREMFVEVVHPILGEVTMPGFPIKFSETKGDMTTPAPLLGQHNAEVYSELLGLSEAEVEELRREGVI